MRAFTLDVRSLAMMRIAVAVTVLVDLATRLVDLSEHYSDAGVLPRGVASSVSWVADTSILSLSGSPIWVAVIFAAAAGIAIAVLVGWRTRPMTLLLWLVMLSIQHRNPLLWDHRDVLFSCALICGLLLPWGDAFSLDARRSPRVDHAYTGAPAVLYVVQIGCIYMFAALLKTGPEWRSDFTAVERAISLDYWARPEAKLLLEHPTIMAVLTAGVLGFEFAVAPLLLFPSRATRWFVVGGLIALQLGFAVFLWLDTFPMIAAAITIGLIPWRDSGPVRREPARGITGIALAVAIYVVVLNLLPLDSVARRPAELLGIDQRWTMFAPSPSRVDGWFVMPSRGPGGTIDLLTGRPMTWARPDTFREGIRTTRELVYLRRLLAMDDAARASFAASQCDDRFDVAVYFVPLIDGVLEDRELVVEYACQSGTIGESDAPQRNR